MTNQNNSVFTFDDVRVDASGLRIWKAGTELELEPKTFQVLLFFLENRGRLIKKNELLDVVWRDAFVTENALAQEISKLRKELGDDPKIPKYIQTAPTQGYRFIALTSESNEDGAGNEDNLTPVKQTSHLSFKKLAPFALAALLVGTIGISSYYFFYAKKSASDSNGRKSIAVLPLKPIHTSSRDEIYDIGIADSLIHRLGSMKELVIRPLSATRKYAESDTDAITAGRELQADYVLVGNYQLDDGKIRVTAQLINIATGQTEETYKSEKDATSLFAMQDAVAADVGNMLLARFNATLGTRVARRGTINEEAYRYYLKGMYLLGKRNTADSRKAVEALDQAVSLDPNYAQAWAGKAHAHRGIVGTTNAHEQYQQSIDAVNKALSLNEELADAHSALCDNKMSYEWDFDGAERECKRSIELDPNSSLSHLVYSRYLNGRGRFDEAIAEVKTAVDLEPASLFSQRNYGTSLYYARRYPEAVEQFKRVIEMDKGFGTTYNWIIVALEMQGNHAEAFEWFMKARAVNYPDQHEISQAYRDAYQASGWQGMLLEQIRRAEHSKTETLRPEHKGNMQSPVYFQSAVLYAKVGNNEKAFEDLEQSLQRREVWMNLLRVEPGLDSLRSDPRFDELVNRVEHQSPPA